MRIAMICPLFPPEVLPGGVMWHRLAQELTRKGYEVTVFTSFPNRPEGIVHKEFRRCFKSVSMEDGFRLIRFWTWLIGPDRSAINRILENVSFGIIGAWHFIFSRRYDVVLFDPWPALSAYFLSMAAKLKKTPSFYCVKDLLPEQAENTGMIKQGGILSKVLMWFDQKACQNSTGLFVLSHGFLRHISHTRGVPPEKIRVAPVQVDISAIYPVNRYNEWRQSHGIGEKIFLVLYTGTIGYVSGISILKDVLPQIDPIDNILFVCIGEGPLKPELEAMAEIYPHFRLLPFQSEADYLLALGAADLTFLPMSPSCGLGSVPSKMYSYMAAGRAVLSNASADSENGMLIQKSGCGLVVPPNDANGLVAALLEIRSRPDMLNQMGERGREYIVNHCTTQHVVAIMENLWLSCVEE